MADIEQILLQEIGVEQIQLQSEFGGLAEVVVKNTLGNTIATVTQEEYVIPDTDINLLDQNDQVLSTDEFVYGVDKLINVMNLSDSMVHIGTTPPLDTNKLWIDTN